MALLTLLYFLAPKLKPSTGCDALVIPWTGIITISLMELSTVITPIYKSPP